MTKDKTTVKELAAELSMAPKDLLQTLQGLSIEAKNASSPISGENAARVRNHVKGDKPASNVIVRRRKTAEPETQAQPATVEDTAEEKVTKEDQAAPLAKKTQAEKKDAPKEEASQAMAEPKAKAKAENKKAAPKDKSSAKPENAARIIHNPKEAAKAEQAHEAAPEKIAATNTEPTIPTAQVEPKDHAEKAESAKDTDNSVSDAAQDAADGAKAKRSAAPQASAMPEGSSAPSLAVQSAQIKSDDGLDDAKPANDERKKRERGGKKRPAPPVTQQVRVISRPEAVAPDSRPSRSEGRSDQRGEGRPDQRGDQRGEGRGDRPRRPGQAGQNRSDRPDRGDRPNRPPRPGQGGGQPGGQPTGDRPDRSGPPRFNRPAGSGGPAGGGQNFPSPEGLGEGQSKKKRMKGRRTVDFQQGGGRFGHDEENAMRLGRSHKSRRKGKDARQATSTTQPLKAAKRKIRVTEAIRVADMAHQMGLKSHEIIKVLFGLGVMATINQALDIETATLVAAEFEYEVEKAGFSEDDYLIPTEADNPENLRPRPPVVTIMGHVDHGKTSLLDAIRKSNVTGGEAGGITQHIGAYHVRTKNGEVVFLDTPGHEAFTQMRARGAQVTDLVILVVAADDGVMEQTREAITHSKAAPVPIMVAVNKMDKEGADPDRVLRELAELGLQAESWGGDTITSLVSAKSRQGLDDLLELVALQAEVLELKANPEKLARGRIVEAKLDKGRGPVATVLIQEGTLRQGDTFVCGVFSGRVRALFNDQGKKVKEAGPSIPVEVQGFDGVPEAGEEFVCVADEKLARRIAETRATKQRERDLAKESKVTLETFLSRRASDQEALTLNLVLKADVQGSLEAITEALLKKSTEKVRINVVHGGAGAISESDILLASASQAIIIGFNVRPTAKIKEVAEHENVDIRFYDIIYKLGDDITSAMKGMLAPVQREQYLGQAEVRETFSVPKVGVIAGCHVADGKVIRNAGIRLLRDGVVVYTGKVSSLKRFKDDAKEVLKGYECGIGLENYNDIKVGDVLESFEMIEEAATL